MTKIVHGIAVQSDAAIRRTVQDMLGLITAAHDRGAITAERKAELTGLIADVSDEVITVEGPMVPYPGTEIGGYVVSIHVEPTAAFLAEVGVAGQAAFQSNKAAHPYA